MSYRSLSAVVLAAGAGTRMRSSTPKMLHPICGRPMLAHIVDALLAARIERVVIVVGHEGERVSATLTEHIATETRIEFVEQPTQRGTGDATSIALGAFADDLGDDDDVIVVPGDTPLVRPETFVTLTNEHRSTDAAATLLSVRLDDPSSYGRVVRDAHGRVERIVEFADATPDEREIDEVNTSIYCFRRSLLAPALRRVSPENAQGEYYLTDVIGVLRTAGHTVAAVVGVEAEVAGVNDRVQLAEAEAEMRRRINKRWMSEGVSMVDPERTYIDTLVELEPDVRLLPGTILEGRTVVGAGAVIGPDTRLIGTIVGERAVVAQTVARDAEIGDDATVGPFAHLRPGTRLGARTHVGSYVETKNADVAAGAKVPHLAYVGDVEIGEGANVGAGTITANYDGVNKHRTKIGKGARTGSNSVLVAPVEVGDGAYTSAGAVVTRNVPPGALAVGVPAKIVEGWVAAREQREREVGDVGVAGESD